MKDKTTPHWACDVCYGEGNSVFFIDTIWYSFGFPNINNMPNEDSKHWTTTPIFQEVKEHSEDQMRDDAVDPLSRTLNPWHPITDPVDLKHLGKLIEEAGELSEVASASSKLCAAAARCMIQGMNEAEPTTGKINKQWLEDEIADVMANSDLVMEHFQLDMDRIFKRAREKKERLREWHKMA